MKIELQGRARLLGNDINTDYIISSSRKKENPDPCVLRRYLMADLDPEFAHSIRDGDLLVAGQNFGCGSAMEVAVTVVLASGIKAVLARSFARTYYRNAINNGLIPAECDTSSIQEGDWLHLMLGDEAVRIMNVSRGFELPGRPLSGIALEILSQGGLIRYFQEHHDFPSPI